MTQMWREWDYLSMCLFQGTVDSLPRRIRYESLTQVIADGLGSLFPKVLCRVSVQLLDQMASFFLTWESNFSCCQDYHYFLFGHPGTLKTSGFTFRSSLSGCTSMIGIEEGRVKTDTDFEGRPVDLIVAPMLMSVRFSRHGSGQIPWMNIPMVVCAGWIEDLDRMEREEDDGMDDTESDRTESDNSKELDRMEDDEGESKHDFGP